MSQDPLDRLRAINPVVGPMTPPSLDAVRAGIAERNGAGPRRPGGRALSASTRRPWAPAGIRAAVVPTLGAAVAAAVVALALITFGHRAPGAHPQPVTPPARSVPSVLGGLTLPRGGMPGVVQLWAAAGSTGGAGIVSFEQCNPCAVPQGQQFREWLAVTGGSATGWSIRSEPFFLISAQFSGPHDIWASGQGRGGGADQVDEMWVSHDAGRRWTRVPTRRAYAPGSVSAAAGEAWAAEPDCARTCRTIVLHGAGAGSTLRPAVVQPAPRAQQAEIVAAGPGTAYLVDGRRLLVTRDDGRSWQTVSTACPTSPDASLAAAGAETLWEQCGRRSGVVVAHTTDGGRHWTIGRPSLPGLLKLVPISGTVAWGLTDGGTVIRTTDGGSHWRRVLMAGRNVSTMSATSAAAATVVRVIARGHVDHHAANSNLVAARTADGGRSWQATVIALPRG